MKNKNPWWLVALLGATGLVGKYRRGLIDMAGVQSAILYLRAVQLTRRTLLALFILTLCLLFFIAGVILLHCALFSFLSGAAAAKSWVLLGMGIVETAASSSYMIWFFSSGRWMNSIGSMHPAWKKIWTQRAL